MSEEPRQLWMLAETLERTAQGHDRCAELMEPFSQDIAATLRKIARQMRETVEQILRGRYGDPGKRP